VLGVAFKANVNDTRHSPAFEVIRQLRQKGVGSIEYSDPHVPSFHVPTEDEPIHMA
jgi:UDP-N-acetyl-D-glucosamine dehydrogenase